MEVPGLLRQELEGVVGYFLPGAIAELSEVWCSVDSPNVEVGGIPDSESHCLHIDNLTGRIVECVSHVLNNEFHLVLTEPRWDPSDGIGDSGIPKEARDDFDAIHACIPGVVHDVAAVVEVEDLGRRVSQHLDPSLA